MSNEIKWLLSTCTLFLIVESTIQPISIFGLEGHIKHEETKNDFIAALKLGTWWPYELDPEVYVLNLHFDHCRRPKTFSWTKKMCECPPPLKEENGQCVCGNCIYENIKQGFSEGSSEYVPRFINDIFEEIHEELVDDETTSIKESEAVKFKNESTNNKKGNDDLYEVSNVINNEHSYQPAVTQAPHSTVIEILSEDVSNEDQIPIGPITTPKPSSTIGSVKILSSRKKKNKYCKTKKKVPKSSKILLISGTVKNAPKLENPNYRNSSTKNLKSSSNLDLRKLKLLRLKSGETPKTYSESVVSGFRSGSIASGVEKAEGSLSSFSGTGAISLGSGGGSAGGTAFTGIGKSNLTVGSEGTLASGFSLIGKNGQHGVSTSSLLLGKGDVIAVNSLGAKGSASGVGVVTKNTAGAATSAFGPASASVSAAVGTGAAQSSSSYNKDLKTSAGVAGQNGTIVESAAVGNPDQDISELQGRDSDIPQTPVNFQPKNFEFNDFFLKGKE